MKTSFFTWVVITTILYFFFSIWNKTWDIMEFSKESTFWFGAFSILGGVIVPMLKYLDGDFSNKKR